MQVFQHLNKQEGPAASTGGFMSVNTLSTKQTIKQMGKILCKTPYNIFSDMEPFTEELFLYLFKNSKSSLASFACSFVCVKAVSFKEDKLVFILSSLAEMKL